MNGASACSSVGCFYFPNSSEKGLPAFVRKHLDRYHICNKYSDSDLYEIVAEVKDEDLANKILQLILPKEEYDRTLPPFDSLLCSNLEAGNFWGLEALMTDLDMAFALWGPDELPVEILSTPTRDNIEPSGIVLVWAKYDSPDDKWSVKRASVSSLTPLTQLAKDLLTSY